MNNESYVNQVSSAPLQASTGFGDTTTSDNKNLNKALVIAIGIASVVLISILIALFVSFFNGGGRNRTIMVYMIGSNLESDGSMASLDINEIKDSNYDSERNKVLVYTGGSKRWALDEISSEENAIFEINGDDMTKVQAYSSKNMTEPANLTEFIDYVYDNYPNDLYDLVLWDHGGGPIYGYGIDENSLGRNPMSIPSLKKALADTKLIKANKKFEIIGFDACLMGSIEIANALKNYSQYMVASEEVEPGLGWNYAFLGNLSRNGDVPNAENLGKSIIDSYISHYDDYGHDVDLSLSLIDLSSIDKLSESVGELFSSVKDEMNEYSFSEYSRTLTRKKVYGYTGRDSESYDLVDLLDLCNSLSESHEELTRKIGDYVNDAVVYQRNNMQGTNGLSMYFVNHNKSKVDDYLSVYKDVAFSDEYYNFLVKYRDYINGKRMVTRGVYDGLEEEKTDTSISVTIPDELKNNYQSAEVIIFRKLGDNKYMPVYRGSNVRLDGNTLSTDSGNLQFVIEVTDKDGEEEYGWTTMYEKERTEEYSDYTTYGVLYYEDKNSSLGFKPMNYEMFIRVKQGENEGEIRDIKVDYDSDLSNKLSLDLDKIRIIEFTVGTYKLFNENGEQDDNFESYGQIYGIGANLAEGDKYKIRMVGLDFDFGDMYENEFESLNEYYAEFVVYDTQGNHHRLNLIQVN